LPVALAALSAARPFALFGSGNLPTPIRPLPPLAVCRSFAAFSSSGRTARGLDIHNHFVYNDPWMRSHEIMKNRLAVHHPGEFLAEILTGIGVSQAAFARAAGVSAMRV
jgi:hypothetical protein